MFTGLRLATTPRTVIKAYYDRLSADVLDGPRGTRIDERREWIRQLYALGLDDMTISVATGFTLDQVSGDLEVLRKAGLITK